MSIRFPSEATDWVEAYAEKLNASEEYGEEGADWGVEFDGSFLFEIRPDDVYEGEPVYLYLDLYDGQCRETELPEDPEAVEYGFALRAEYSDWKDLIEGKLNPVEAILSGPFDLEGDRIKVTQWSGAGVTMVDLAAEVDTQFDY